MDLGSLDNNVDMASQKAFQDSSHMEEGKRYLNNSMVQKMGSPTTIKDKEENQKTSDKVIYNLSSNYEEFFYT